MRASACLTVTRSSRDDRCRITRLRSDPPLVLRSTNPDGPEPPRSWELPGRMPVRVALAAGAAGPVGGDDLRLAIDVEGGAALVLRSVAATLALPGPHGLPSRSEVVVWVAEDGILSWLPGPLIAARGCDHHESITVALDPGARFLLREELILGRHSENPGSIRRRLRVCLAGRPLLDQELAIGPGAPGWNGPAVTGGRKALGALLLIDPSCENESFKSRLPAPTGDTAVMPLQGPAVLVTALAIDSLALRRQLDAALAAVESALAPVGNQDACLMRTSAIASDSG
jgi:urease accessory protein